MDILTRHHSYIYSQPPHLFVHSSVLVLGPPWSDFLRMWFAAVRGKTPRGSGRNLIWTLRSSVVNIMDNSQPLQWLVHLRPASPLDNCPSQTSQLNWPVTGPKLTGRSFNCTHLWPTGRLYCTSWTELASPCWIWSHCRLTGWLCIVTIFDRLASLVWTSLTDWPTLYCNHLWLAGWSCIVPQPLDVTLH